MIGKSSSFRCGGEVYRAYVRPSFCNSKRSKVVLDKISGDYVILNAQADG